MDLDNLLKLWIKFSRENRCSIDRMLCRPSTRNQFLANAMNALNCSDEEALLWAVVGLRKRKKIPKQK